MKICVDSTRAVMVFVMMVVDGLCSYPYTPAPGCTDTPMLAYIKAHEYDCSLQPGPVWQPRRNVQNRAHVKC